MPTHHPPVGSIHLMYSDNCDKHILWSAEIFNSSEREEYTKVNAFQKDGKGVILFRDNQGNIAFALLCRWVEGQLRGKGYLYDVQQSDFRSIVTFCGNVLVDEVAFYHPFVNKESWTEEMARGGKAPATMEKLMERDSSSQRKTSRVIMAPVFITDVVVSALFIMRFRETLSFLTWKAFGLTTFSTVP